MNSYFDFFGVPKFKSGGKTKKKELSLYGLTTEAYVDGKGNYTIGGGDMNLDELVVTPQGTTVQPVSGASSNWTSEYDSEREMQGHPERIKYNDDRAKLIDNLWRNGGVDPITGKVFDNSTSKALDAATVGVGTAIAAPFVAPAIGSALAPPVAKTIAAQQAFTAAHPFIATGINTFLTGLGLYNLGTSEGIQKTYRLAKEGKTGRAILSGLGDTMDLMGAGEAFRVAKNIANPLYRAGHAYVNITPAGYDGVLKQGKDFIKGLLSGKAADINSVNPLNNPKMQRLAGDYVRGSYGNGDEFATTVVAEMARDDAWRKYLGLPEKYGMYLSNGDNTFRYNLDRIHRIVNSKLRPKLLKLKGSDGKIYKNIDGNGYDYVTGSGGGLTGNWSTVMHEDPTKIKGVQTITDRWDLHPFSRPGDTVLERLGLNPNIPVLRKINNKLKNFEVGPVLGGKPFEMKTEIPFEYDKITGATRFDQIVK